MTVSTKRFYFLVEYIALPVVIVAPEMKLLHLRYWKIHFASAKFEVYV